MEEDRIITDADGFPGKPGRVFGWYDKQEWVDVVYVAQTKLGWTVRRQTDPICLMHKQINNER